MKRDPIDRFEEKYFADPNSGCWIWSGHLFVDGYASFYDGKNTVRGHRFSYERAYGPIPNGLLACHKCDTPSCVNPDHIFLGTQRDNLSDCRKKNRIYKKLDNDKVGEIRRRAIAGEPQQLIARHFGIHQSLVSYIKNAAHHGQA